MSAATHALVGSRVEVPSSKTRWRAEERRGVVVSAIKGGKVLVRLDVSSKEMIVRPGDLRALDTA